MFSKGKGKYIVSREDVTVWRKRGVRGRWKLSLFIYSLMKIKADFIALNSWKNYFWTAWWFMIEPICFCETSVTNYQSTRRNIPEKRRYNLYHSGSLDIWIMCFKVQNLRQVNKESSPLGYDIVSLVTWFWPFKKNVVPSPSRVNESKRPSSSGVKDEDEDITFLRNVASHNTNCRAPSPATVPQITLPVTHSYTLYTLSDTPEFTISLNVQVMSVLSPYVMTAILTEAQTPIKPIYCLLLSFWP
jgi:hypothetical protein